MTKFKICGIIIVNGEWFICTYINYDEYCGFFGYVKNANIINADSIL